MDNKVRVDIFLANKYGISRSKITKFIKDGLVHIDGKLMHTPGEFIEDGEHTVTLDQNQLDQCNQITSTIKPYRKKLNIVYEDDDLLVINKPSGLLTHPTKYGEENTLANMIAYYAKSMHEPRNGIVHRIDRDTSGLVLVAKNLKTLTNLQQQIQSQAMERNYLTIVHKPFSEIKGRIEAPIGYCSHNKMKMKINGINAKQAVTNFHVLVQNETNALVCCSLLTGRTHQIRVHMQAINHPIVNDSLYGNNNETKTDYGQYLHAYMLAFNHPTKQTKVCFKVKPDQTFIKKIWENNFDFDLNTLYE